MAFMRYSDYKSVGVPLGSGVTEAACKTVYTQRLKLSGMAWESTGSTDGPEPSSVAVEWRMGRRLCTRAGNSR